MKEEEGDLTAENQIQNDEVTYITFFTNIILFGVFFEKSTESATYFFVVVQS
jgi:hypothetical protein